MTGSARRGRQRRDASIATHLAAMVRLQEVSTRLVRDDDPAPAILEILDAAIDVTAADMGTVRLLDPTTGNLPIVASRGLDDEFLTHFAQFPAGEDVLSVALEGGERVVVADVATSDMFTDEARSRLLRADIRAMQFTPLVDRSGRLLGVLSTLYRAAGGPSSNDLRLLDLLARQAAAWVARTLPKALSGGGEMGARMRAMDWTRTPVGPVETWPQSLRSVLSMLLPSKAQIILFWGSEFIVFYNDAYRPVFGAKHPHALGKPGREAWSEIWESQLHELLAGVVRTGDAFQAKDLLFVVERYGFVEETYFDVSYDPVRDESGGVGGVYCIVTETTGRVVGERRLALLKDLAARNAVARTARDACMLAMETLAAKPDDVPFALAYLGNELQAATPDAESALASADSRFVRELPIAAAAGGAGPSGRLVVGLNPKLPFDDQYRSFLDLVSGQLATAITNGQAYEDARARADALADLDRAKTAFFSNVSHEFRTPITLLLAPVGEMLADHGRSQADRHALELIERNGVRLLKLVNTLLDFSRIEAGRIQARYVPTDLGTATTEVASAFRSTIERAGLRLRVECDALAGPAYVDREMWEKIVLNLLSNAYKHTFEGEIAVRLREEDDRLILTVADTGIGIPSDHLARVFDRFHQVPSARSRTHEGSGIGLSLVRELVHLHGGTIEVRSVVGSGSVFEIRIPVGYAHLPAEHVSHDATAQPAAAAADTIIGPFVREAAQWTAAVEAPTGVAPNAAETGALAGTRILVVDDNADMREYVSRLLAEGGAQVIVATNGRDALDTLRRDGAVLPDVVLSDVMMPELDGFGLLKAIRADERLRTLPFIVVSARAGEESRVGGLVAGADDYLIKPFIARELIARVASQLRLARARVSEREARTEADDARKQMSRLFEQAPVPICVFEGRELLYTTANASYRHLIGNRDPVGKTLLALWPELAGSELHGVFQNVLTTGEPYGAQEFQVQFDRFGTGTRVDSFFNFVCHPLTDARGATTGIIAVAVDVTPQVVARREAERLQEAAEAAKEAMRESEERFRSFFELGLVGMAITLPNRQLFAVNDRLCDLFGYSRDELLSLLWSDLTHPDDLGADLGRFERVLAGHEDGYTLEKRFIRKGGSVIDARMSVGCVREADGRVRYFVALVDDVTEHKRAEEAVRVSDERFRLASEALAGFIYDYDAQTDRVQRYGNFMAVLGFSVEAVPEAASWWRDRIHPDDFVGARSVVRAAIGGGAPSYHVNYRVQHRDGHYVDLAEEAHILRNADNSLARIVGGFNDITSRRTLERERQTLLERERNARDVAERAVLATDRVVSIVGHDLRTSVSVVDLCAASLLSDRDMNAATMRATVRAIRLAAMTMDRLIRDLLDVTLLEEGRLTLHLHDEHPRVILRLAVGMFSAAARKRGISIRIARIPRLPMVRADRERLLQTLGNLITNAIKYSAAGDAITLRASRGTRTVSFVVEDTGVGISAEDLPHVFDRWWRGSNAERAGTGLGLSIARGIVRAHGGTVSARSTAGKGSRFSFTIPVVSRVS